MKISENTIPLPGLWTGQGLHALVEAAFSHAYIWVHFYATEKPDMDYLYQ